MYEMVVGPYPFGSDNDDQVTLFRNILEAPLEFPEGIGDAAATSIVSGLLERAPELRLGSSACGATHVKEHRYFWGFDWQALAGRSFEPPWKPDVEKLKTSWEPQGGRQIAEISGRGSTSLTMEPGMEWAAVF